MKLVNILIPSMSKTLWTEGSIQFKLCNQNQSNISFSWPAMHIQFSWSTMHENYKLVY